MLCELLRGNKDGIKELEITRRMKCVMECRIFTAHSINDQKFYYFDYFEIDYKKMICVEFI